jgi:hypothetical protein
MEHRWGERISLRLPVRLLTTADASEPGVLRNLSTSGAFIETAGRFPVLWALEVELPGRPRVAAFVVRRNTRGIGVEWSETLDVSSWQIVQPHLPPTDRPGAINGVHMP